MASTVLIPSGALGLGFSADALARGVAAGADVIAIDGGSTDSGPHYLGTGTSKYARARTKAEWGQIMAARAQLGVPLIIGTAGTCGADSAVDWLVDITRDLAQDRGERLKICTVKSNQPAQRVKAALAAGRIQALAPEQPLDDALLDQCTNIVALAGVEQIQHALNTGADIIIAGRTTDTAVIAAHPIAQGADVGAAWHGAKIGECGALATTHPASGVIAISFDDTGFTITPMADGAQATPRTVSAHMLYENSNPFVLYEPGGHLDVTGAKYSALDDKTVRVEGSAWVATHPYTVKLEGARLAGYQTLSHVLVRDAKYVARIDEWLAKVRAGFLRDHPDFDTATCSIEFRVVGQSATLGELETRRAALHEVGIITVVTAPTQAQATDIARALNPALLHLPLEDGEPMPTFAFPFSPAETERGAIYEFCLNHTMALDDPLQAFAFEELEVGP